MSLIQKRQKMRLTGFRFQHRKACEHNNNPPNAMPYPTTESPSRPWAQETLGMLKLYTHAISMRENMSKSIVIGASDRHEFDTLYSAWIKIQGDTQKSIHNHSVKGSTGKQPWPI
jgi:hypothetical protein